MPIYWQLLSLGVLSSFGRLCLPLQITQRQDRNDEPLKLFERTLGRAQAAKLVDVQIAAGVGLGGVLSAKRDFPSALKAINESLELARRVNAKSREAELLWRAAQTYLRCTTIASPRY
jgi:hypothetical protein